jgi:SAM-dependent methyltransferase
MYSADTVESSSIFKRFSHSKRFDFALELMEAPRGSRLLDYGTGDGRMLSLLSSLRPDSEIWGFEPVSGMRDELAERFRKDGIGDRIRVVDNPDELVGKGFDRVCCLEVLEHLPEHILLDALTRMRDLLAPGARLVVSVPLETGLSSVVKTVIRALQRQKHPDTNVANIAKSVIGKPIDRSSDGSYHLGHVGFSYRQLEKRFAQVGFTIEKRFFSPVPFLGSFLNSQVFYTLSAPSSTSSARWASAI